MGGWQGIFKILAHTATKNTIERLEHPDQDSKVGLWWGQYPQFAHATFLLGFHTVKNKRKPWCLLKKNWFFQTKAQ